MTKHKFFVILPAMAAVLTALFSSCGAKTPDDNGMERNDSVVFTMEQTKMADVIRFERYEETDSLSGGTHRYSYHFVLEPVDSLGIITDTDGYKAVDNALRLTVRRDGQQVFNGRFTRRAFTEGISSEEMSHYILLNMAFDRWTEQGLRFTVSVGMASADDVYRMFNLIIGPDGSASIKPREEFFDNDEIDRLPEDELV